MSFDLNRLRRSDWITGGGAVAFFVFLFFFDWYGGSYKGTVPSGGTFGTSVSSSGWDTFTNSRWIWLITIVVALGAVLLVAAQRTLELPARPGAIVAGLGALSTVLILYRIIHHPSGGASFAGASFNYGIKIGIWLGLIAAAAITYGGYLTMSEEGASPSDITHPAPTHVGGTHEDAPLGSYSDTPADPAQQAAGVGQQTTSPGESPPLPPSSPSSSSGDTGF